MAVILCRPASPCVQRGAEAGRRERARAPLRPHRRRAERGRGDRSPRVRRLHEEVVACLRRQGAEAMRAPLKQAFDQQKPRGSRLLRRGRTSRPWRRAAHRQKPPQAVDGRLRVQCSVSSAAVRSLSARRGALRAYLPPRAAGCRRGAATPLRAPRGLRLRPLIEPGRKRPWKETPPNTWISSASCQVVKDRTSAARAAGAGSAPSARARPRRSAIASKMLAPSR